MEEKIYRLFEKDIELLLKYKDNFKMFAIIFENFEINIHRVKQDYNLSMKDGVLSQIYTLVDAIYFCLDHSETEIYYGYNLSEGLSDLELILNMIKHNKIYELENNYSLINRIDCILKD